MRTYIDDHHRCGYCGDDVDAALTAEEIIAKLSMLPPKTKVILAGCDCHGPATTLTVDFGGSESGDWRDGQPHQDVAILSADERDAGPENFLYPAEVDGVLGPTLVVTRGTQHYTEVVDRNGKTWKPVHNEDPMRFGILRGYRREE